MADIRRQPTATETERLVAGIWCEVLDLPEVGMTDNFFDLGGHSVLLHMVLDLVTERLGKQPSVVDLFQYPTVRALARWLDEGAGADTVQSPATARGSQLRARRLMR